MHPVLLELPMPWGPTPLYAYGVMLGTAFIVAWYSTMYLGARRERLEREVMATCFIITAVSAIVASRLLYALTNPDEFDSIGDLLNLQGGGLVAYGGFLGGLLGSGIYLRIKKVSLLAWADVVAPPLAMGLGLVRIGCYSYGCDFGAPLTDGSPRWLRDIGTFPRWTEAHFSDPAHLGTGSPAGAHHVGSYDLSPLADYSLPVHPTQLYESLAGFALAGVALAVWRRRRFRGQVILVVAVLYGAWRFLIEYVRDDPERGFYFGFSTSQLISLVLVPICGFLYYELLKRSRSEPLELVPAAVTTDASDGTEARPKKRKKKRKKKRG